MADTDAFAPPSFDEIAEDMAFLDEWEDRYRYVIDLGKAMPPMEEALKTPATKVDGCASQVWIATRRDGAAIAFQGDSDAMIVRGLIAVLRALYDRRTPDEMLAVDAQGAFARLGLDQALSAQRSNGLRAMIARLRETAAAAD
jgi:cysteine desulfuration protein SufE